MHATTAPKSRLWKDPASALSHFFGFLAAIVGLVVLISQGLEGEAKILSLSAYCCSLITLFLASSVYHFFDLGPRGNKMLRRFDHAAIFLLIAGTYLPPLVHFLDGAWRMNMLLIIGGAGALGAIFKLTIFNCPRWVNAGLYLAMGWMALVALPKMSTHMGTEHWVWLMSGAGFYTVGAIVYATKRPDPWPERFGFHEIWHMFVLGGAACHFGLNYTLIDVPYVPF